jgi:protein-S-isoprenylcysteine O-methyltransferase Ste14
MKTKRALPPTYLFGSVVIMGLLHFLAPISKIIPAPWNLLGAIPLALGIVLNVVADAAFKKHGTTVKPFEESTILVTTGAYRFSRHPMYLGMVLILTGIAIFIGTLSPFIAIVAFGILMEAIFIRTEERMLKEKFGEAWVAYTKRVRRWV